jgi:hypothetical protein
LFSHTLQLAVQKALQDRSNIFQSPLEKAKAISGKLSKSVQAKEKLLQCGGLAVKTYCRTRWFSELHLVDSVLANHERPEDPLALTLAFLLLDELVPTAVVSKISNVKFHKAINTYFIFSNTDINLVLAKLGKKILYTVFVFYLKIIIKLILRSKLGI